MSAWPRPHMSGDSSEKIIRVNSGYVGEVGHNHTFVHHCTKTAFCCSSATKQNQNKQTKQLDRESAGVLATGRNSERKTNVPPSQPDSKMQQFTIALVRVTYSVYITIYINGISHLTFSIIHNVSPTERCWYL